MPKIKLKDTLTISEAFDRFLLSKKSEGLKVYDPSAYFWYDYVIAVIYFVIVFFFCFRSPLFWKLGKVEGYPLTERSAYGIR